jgi:hypothetical protein
MNKAIAELEEERNRLRGELVGTAKLLIMQLKRVISDLEDANYSRVNESGFFQGQAVGFDILCAKYEMTKWHLQLMRAEQLQAEPTP